MINAELLYTFTALISAPFSINSSKTLSSPTPYMSGENLSPSKAFKFAPFSMSAWTTISNPIKIEIKTHDVIKICCNCCDNDQKIHVQNTLSILPLSAAHINAVLPTRLKNKNINQLIDLIFSRTTITKGFYHYVLRSWHRPPFQWVTLQRCRILFAYAYKVSKHVIAQKVEEMNCENENTFVNCYVQRGMILFIDSIDFGPIIN